MNSKFSLIAVTAMLSLMPAVSASAQSSLPAKGAAALVTGSHARAKYNPATTETIRGKVVKVERTARAWGGRGGLQLLVKSNGKTVPVHLGPSRFIQQQGFNFESGDNVEITGSRVTLQGKPALLAADVNQRGRVLVLRGADGRPAWNSRAPRNRMQSQGMMGRGMMGRGMMGQRQEMMNWKAGPGPAGRATGMMPRQMLARRQRMLSRMQAMDARLNRDVARMNTAKGKAKVKAMANVIDLLVKQREDMMRHLMPMPQPAMPRRQSMRQQWGSPATGHANKMASSSTTTLESRD